MGMNKIKNIKELVKCNALLIFPERKSTCPISKTSPEEAIVISSEKMKPNYVKECLKELFFTNWHLANLPSTRGQEFLYSVNFTKFSGGLSCRIPPGNLFCTLKATYMVE